MGMNSIAHPAINNHGLYSDEVASEMVASGDFAVLGEIIPEVAGPLSDALTALGRF